MNEAQFSIDDVSVDLPSHAVPTIPVLVQEGTLLQAMNAASPELAKLKDMLSQLDLSSNGEDIVTAFIETINASGVVGFAGAGFPVAHKLNLLRQVEGGETLLICNANAYGFSRIKAKHLLQRCPVFLRTALLLLGKLAGVSSIVLCTNLLERDEAAEFGPGWPISKTSESGTESGVVQVLSLEPAFVVGEETALFNRVCGKPAIPDQRRAGPILRDPLTGKVGIVLNIESILRAAYALAVGPSIYKRQGSLNSPGSMVFNVVGDVSRPGLYEVPFGTSLSDLIEQYAGGLPSGEKVLTVFPGGIGSKALGPEDLNISLDHLTLRGKGNTLGRGDIIVFSDKRTPVTLARWLTRFLRNASCGKCHSCFETLDAIDTIFSGIDERSRDTQPVALPTKAVPQLNILNNAAAREPLYTETLKGVDKITGLCAFMRFRGDCGFTAMASNSIQSMIDRFPKEFSKIQ